MSEPETPIAEGVEPPAESFAPQPAVFVPPVAPPPPPRRSRVGMFFFGALSGCLLVFLGVFLIALMVAAGSDGTELNLAGEKVAVVPIEGEILEARDTVELLHRYAGNDSVKAIVVRINSPGGAIAPSQEIYSAILKTRANGKPVIASMDSVAASGGYYIASA